MHPIILSQLASISVKASLKGDNNYDLTLCETKLDICRVAKGVRSSYFSKIAFENFEKSVPKDQILNCKTTKKDTIITAINQTITTNFLPPFPRVLFPSGELPFRVEAVYRAKIQGMKKLIKFYSFTIRGAIYDGSLYKNAIKF